MVKSDKLEISNDLLNFVILKLSLFNYYKTDNIFYSC